MTRIFCLAPYKDLEELVDWERLKLVRRLLVDQFGLRRLPVTILENLSLFTERNKRLVYPGNEDRFVTDEFAVSRLTDFVQIREPAGDHVQVSVLRVCLNQVSTGLGHESERSAIRLEHLVRPELVGTSVLRISLGALVIRWTKYGSHPAQGVEVECWLVVGEPASTLQRPGSVRLLRMPPPLPSLPGGFSLNLLPLPFFFPISEILQTEDQEKWDGDQVAEEKCGDLKREAQRMETTFSTIESRFSSTETEPVDLTPPNSPLDDDRKAERRKREHQQVNDERHDPVGNDEVVKKHRTLPWEIASPSDISPIQNRSPEVDPIW